MGTIAKKTPTKSDATPLAALAKSIPLATLDPALDVVYGLGDKVVAYLLTLPRTALFPQLVLRFALVIDIAISRLEKYQEAIKGAVGAHYSSGGPFEVGKVAVTFPSSSKRSPKWKEEAQRLAHELANLKGEPFDAEKWADSVAGTYPLKESVSVKLVESV